MMLEKTTDTTVRGVVYEAAGTVGRGARARRRGSDARRTNEIPFALLEPTPRTPAWLAARAAIDGLLAARLAARRSTCAAQPLVLAHT